MGMMVKFLAKKTFNKIFANIAKELGEPVANIQIGIYYKDGVHKFEVFRKFIREKDIELDDYVGGAVDFSGGTAVIEATIAQSGPKYAKEIGCEVSDVKIIMQHNEKSGLPDTVLLNGKTKVRKIDIEKEFLND